MKYQVGQMLKYVGPNDSGIHPGMVGVVEPPDVHTRIARLMMAAPYYNMNFPGYWCAGCGSAHNLDVAEDVLKPIDDPDADEEQVTDEELDEELTR